MEYIIIIGGGAVIALVGVIWYFFNHNKNKTKEQEKISQEMKQKLSQRIPHDSFTKELISSTKGEAKNGGGILISRVKEKNDIVKDKAAKWVETTSYDDDIKNETVTVKPVVSSDSNFKPLVLLVDDSLVVRKYVGDLLRKNNYDLVIKNDGWEAITYLNSISQKPELIVSDIEMPNMNGFQLIEAIRKKNKYDNVPILVISAHAESHLKLMESENIQGFIKKPFEDSDLLEQADYLIKNF